MKGEPGELKSALEGESEINSKNPEAIIAHLLSYAIGDASGERFCIVCRTRLVPSKTCKIKSALLCPKCDIIHIF